jgi:hypothetical protein
MAKEKEIKEVINEEKDKKSESSENKQVTKAKAIEKTPVQPKSYVHIDTFLQSAVPMFGLSNIQAAGFKARMNGRHYQHDEQDFLQELKQYLKLK